MKYTTLLCLSRFIAGICLGLLALAVHVQDAHAFLPNPGPACRFLTQTSQRTGKRVGVVLLRSTDCSQQPVLPPRARPEASALKQQPCGIGQLSPEHEFQRLSRRAAAISTGTLIGCLLGADSAVVHAQEQDADDGSPSDPPGESRKEDPRKEEARKMRKKSKTRQCDEKCQEMIKERRAMLQQSRTTRSRQEVLDLSRQRAKLYGVESKAVDCSKFKGIPCM